MQGLFRYILGYVCIRIDGTFPERFLNVCAANRIKLWDYDKKGKYIYAKVLNRDYFKLRELRRRCEVRIKIVSKYGFKIKTKPYKKRYGLIFGTVLYALIMVFLSNFIWNIEIKGNKNITNETILENCKSIGIYEGAFKGKIDTEDARLKLIMHNGDISWASFIIEGSHLTVNISETLKADKSDTSPSNLVATTDGVIERIEIKRGMPTVKVNQAVLKGELLATGAMQYTDGTTHFVNSSGKVIAKTKRRHTVKINCVVSQKVYSGKKEIRKLLKLFGISIPLNYTPVPKPTDKITEEIKIMCDTSYVPIYITKTTFMPYKNEKVKLNKKEMVARAEKELKQYEQNEMSQCEIISYEDDITKTEKELVVTRHYVCRENIAKIEKIKINTVN